MTDMGPTNGNVADAAMGIVGGEDNSGGSFFNQPEPQTQQTQPQPNQPQESQGNPAWNDLLGVIPNAFHNQVKPYLEQWDKGVQDRFTQQAQQLAPWKEFIDNKIDPDTLRGMVWLLENDPKRLYDELGTLHGYASQGQQQGAELNLDEIQDPEGQQQVDLSQIPEFQQLQMSNQQLQQMVQGQIEQQQQAQAQQELQSEIDAVTQKNPGIIEPILLSLAHTYQVSVTDAVPLYEKYMAQSGQANQRPQAPTVLAPTGGVPLSNMQKPSEMTRQQRKELAIEYLKAAHQQT